MLRSQPQSRPPSALLLLTLAVLVVLAAPSSGGLALGLATIIIAGAAGFAAAHGEPQRVSTDYAAVRGRPACAPRVRRDEAAEPLRMRAAFDDVATLRLHGAIARLRPPVPK